MKFGIKELTALFAIVLLLAVVVEAATVSKVTVQGGGTLANGVFAVNATNLSNSASGVALFANDSIKMVGSVDSLNIVMVGWTKQIIIEGTTIYPSSQDFTMWIGPGKSFKLEMDGSIVETQTKSVSLSVSSSSITI